MSSLLPSRAARIGAATMMRSLRSDPLWGRFAAGPARFGLVGQFTWYMEWDRVHGLLDVDKQGRSWVASWQLPSTPPLTRAMSTLLRWSSPLAYGGLAPAMLDFFEQLDAERALFAPHVYLEFLGVDPGEHGKGLGTAALQRGLGVADSRGLPVYLETFKADNIQFYRRSGFAVDHQIPTPLGVVGWAMWRAVEP